MTDTGDIFSQEAYALGKMLDHSGWLKNGQALSRGITPSDFDIVIDNRGRILFGELSSACERWADLKNGQRGAYQSAIRNSGVHCAVLCRHNVDLAQRRKIDTRADVVAFQAMVYHFQSFRVSRVIEGNASWQAFVLAWDRNPDGLRGNIIEKSEPIPSASWF